MLLLSDTNSEKLSGRRPKFAQAERSYLVEAIRYVSQLAMVDGAIEPDSLPAQYAVGPAVWAVPASEDTPGTLAFCDAHGLEYAVVEDLEIQGFPEPAPEELSAAPKSRKKVLVTGCFDWLHSGHARFFEEVAALGDLYVVLGHDQNIKLLKGEGHPMHPEEERRYMVGAIRHVKQALLTSGHGWLDAEPEIERFQPDLYVVNEDGDRPEKREYCDAHGIEYRVLKRQPKEGLPARQSTDLRGF